MGPAGCDVWLFPWPTSTGGMVSWLCMMEVASAGHQSPMPGTRWVPVLRPHGMWAVSLMPSWGRTRCWRRRRWIFGPCPSCHRKSGHRAGGPVGDFSSGEPALCPGESLDPCRLARGGPGAAPFAWPAALVGREVPSAAPAQARWHLNHTPLPPHISDHEWGPPVCSRGCSCSPSGGGLWCRCQWSHPGCCRLCPRHSEIPGCRRPRPLWKWVGDHSAPGQWSWWSLVSVGRVAGPGPGGGSGRPPHIHSHDPDARIFSYSSLSADDPRCWSSVPSGGVTSRSGLRPPLVSSACMGNPSGNGSSSARTGLSVGGVPSTAADSCCGLTSPWNKACRFLLSYKGMVRSSQRLSLSWCSTIRRLRSSTQYRYGDSTSTTR